MRNYDARVEQPGQWGNRKIRCQNPTTARGLLRQSFPRIVVGTEPNRRSVAKVDVAVVDEGVGGVETASTLFGTVPCGLTTHLNSWRQKSSLLGFFIHINCN